jgi:cysteine-rich repeat protein
MNARTPGRWVVAALALLGAGPATATFHLTKIVEVFPGTAAAPQAQYVVIQMYVDGQNIVGGHSLTVHGADGAAIATVTFSGNVPGGASQDRILVATAEAATFFGLTADFTMGAVLPLTGGKVCFAGVDCVAWGEYAMPGGDPTVGTPFNSPAAPVPATPGPGLLSGRALLRRLDLAGSPILLDPGDDTDVSANDFLLGPPAPRNNHGDAGAAPAATCGDGALGGLEGCDDGGTISGDGCSSTCALEFCGDAALNGEGEICDDGNRASGDGCDANCTPTGCGNGVLTAGEACDDSNLVSGDGCDANCTLTGCGNGVVTQGEICDDSNLVSGDGCDANCTPTGCGNGIVTEGEACEPPGVGTCGPDCQRICVGDPDCADADPCTVAERCVGTACAVDPAPTDDGEPCTVDSCDASGVHHVAMEDGAACVLAAQPGARALCLAGVCGVSRCGDGWVDAGAPGGGEACDDGDAVDDDGCTNACTLPRCGDGIVQAGEECDGGAQCSASCRSAMASSGGCGCGNGGAPVFGLVAVLAGALALPRRPRQGAGRRAHREPGRSPR